MHPAASNVTQSPIGMSSIVAIAVRPISAWTLLRDSSLRQPIHRNREYPDDDRSDSLE
jgi:hypothetical protein